MLESITSTPAVSVADVVVGYGIEPVVKNVSFTVGGGEVVTVIGPNGCGKSTLLKGVARLLPLTAGTVQLNGKATSKMTLKDQAKSLAFLPQNPVAPNGVTVEELVGRGRHPHHTWFSRAGVDDGRAIERAMELTNVADLRDRYVTELSGGQRQRVWIAMVLAQETSVIFLDEPTSYLDLTHAMDVLDLVARLNEEEGKSFVMVLHDLNLAARYSSTILLMRDGQLKASGSPAAVVTEDNLLEHFGLEASVYPDPLTATPMVVPQPRRHRCR